MKERKALFERDFPNDDFEDSLFVCWRCYKEFANKNSSQNTRNEKSK